MRDFFSSNLGLVWFDLVVYQVSTFYYVWNWSKSLWWWVVVVVVVGVESNFSVTFGPNLKTKTLLHPRPKLNNNEIN